MTPIVTREHPVAIRYIGHVSTLCGIAASLMILASVLITCQMIFVRTVLNRSTVWQTEVVIYLMIAATLIGLPYVQKLRGHVGVDLLPTLLPASFRRALAGITLAVTAAMMAVMLFYGWEMWYLAWVRNWKSETVMAVPLWIPWLFVPLGFGLFLLQLAADLWLTLRGAPMDEKGLPAIGPEPLEEY
ncbi:MAG: TRAP transporter small permease [Jannaschia helgolandensis]|uniref:TRAP transporter small permease protein n=1 Tax=Jannaschia helgolandensis TaxID=188906 RepID=A0A1H7NIJ5_9RHOB|nr:TRAP transporter small permease [Jannaschia helgolandensis]SEL23139.1 TRAP-type C4-dicarboxylate transport system, small permease component [Jannaschia helgolandensis]